MSGIWQRLKRNLRSDAASANAAPETPIADAERLIAAGNALEDDGEFAAALDRYRAAAAIAPDFPRVHMNVGNALRRLERWDEAIAAQRRAVECAPEYAPARFNLGFVLGEHGERSAAEGELREARRLAPGMIEAYVALADLYDKEERFNDAERELRKACEIDPLHAGASLNLGSFCFKQGDLENALNWLQRARNLDPELKGVDSAILFAMNFRADLSPEEVALEHARVGDVLARAAGPRYDTWQNEIDPDRRLKVAYVSGDFGPHPVALFIRPILEHHDRSKFEVFCYSNSPDFSSITQILRERADHWRDIAALTDPQVVDLVRNDGIDIMIDLSGHTKGDRLSVFARHPAPVQVTWLGYLNTTGLTAMDYRITDVHTDPLGETEEFHTERLVRMPYSQWCYFAWHDVAAIPTPHAEQPDALLFGSFNQYAKLTDTCLALWARVLDRVPHAGLVVLDVRQERNRTSLLERMSRLGIDVGRVTLHGRLPKLDYFAAIGNVDVALDTIPYNGATTTLDALWMGVPIVALHGDRGISRGSMSILRSLGLDELIAESADQYEELHAKLARDRDWRARLRQTLRDRMVASPLMDAPAFTRALESRYREMWKTWCGESSTD